MRKRIIIALYLTLCFCGQTFAQQIKASKQPLTEVLQQIEQKTGYRFYWMPDEVKDIRVSINADAKDMGAFLKTLLIPTNLKYTIYGNRNVFILKDRRLVTPFRHSPNGRTIATLPMKANSCKETTARPLPKTRFMW